MNVIIENFNFNTCKGFTITNTENGKRFFFKNTKELSTANGKNNLENISINIFKDNLLFNLGIGANKKYLSPNLVSIEDLNNKQKNEIFEESFSLDDGSNYNELATIEDDINTLSWIFNLQDIGCITEGNILKTLNVGFVSTQNQGKVLKIFDAIATFDDVEKPKKISNIIKEDIAKSIYYAQKETQKTLCNLFGEEKYNEAKEVISHYAKKVENRWREAQKC
jgi:hypothetical protein